MSSKMKFVEEELKRLRDEDCTSILGSLKALKVRGYK